MTDELRGWARDREAEAAREEAEATLERSVWYWRGKQVAYREMQQVSEPDRADTAALVERAATDIYALDADWCEVHDVATVHREDAIAALRAALEAR